MSTPNTALTILGQKDIQKGGLGTASKLFKLKPATIQLVQKMTRAEGAIAGKLRIKETGQHFDVMHLVLLKEPEERRSYFEGEDFSPENQLCFSLDNVYPHPKAKIPQAMNCANCPKGSWEKYRKTGQKSDIPKCKNYFHNVVVDRVTKMPYFLDVKSTSIKPYLNGMQNVARIIAQMQADGQNPNIFDVSFKIRAKAEGKGTYYTLDVFDAAPIAAEEREQFGNIFLDFVNRFTPNEADDQTIAKAAQQEAEYLDAEIVESGDQTNPIDGGEITI